ncbi:ASCH domain-containing protein [Mesorhizobium sp. B2-1-3]|uniref:ASCH domain-containing protein n=1 Tax=Mesorhizobium sp. B2-1-3 TaxID=2589972 RepID=UPI00112BA57B|nr:ASCH domain-containing protein [Mesorhizobium sp. B2-1-3]TPN03848.1 ASCH domain-containing protein [Mesorhizobium sp. B2-1-3]
MRTLTLPLNAEYFDAIKGGEKLEEYRLEIAYWRKRLAGRAFDKIVLTKGYPTLTEFDRRIERPWRGYSIKTITHPHFGPDPVTVYAIIVNIPHLPNEGKAE